MKVPLKWLADHVDLTGINVPDLVERLTLAGLEVAGVRFLGIPTPEGLKAKVVEPGPIWDTDKIITARVLGIEKHPNADKLKLVTLDYGAAEPKTVVTGAPNIAVGEKDHKVVVGLRGSVYFAEEEDKQTKALKKVFKTLEPKALRGIPNDAMCMSNFELGVNDEHEGIILFEDDAPVGVPLADFMGDAVVEIDVLPNMARCLSMIGVAREVAAIFGASTKSTKHEPTFEAESVDGKVAVEIVNSKLSARYSAMVIRDVTIKPSPGWMQRRLTYAGMRPINNIVDITNYIMLEWGQPLHAFDYDILVQRAGGKAPTIIVRPAKDGEILKTLDGVERKLSPENLVIADTVGPIALAGVMGGAETEVSATTKNILLESANFDPVIVRRTAHQFTLFSEASTRFSRGIHPEVVLPAAYHAAKLMAEYAGGKVLKGVVDKYVAPFAQPIVKLPKKEVRRLLGIDFPDAEVERVLKALQFDVKPLADGWDVTVPTSRLDIQAGAADLVEELVRIYGYDRLPSTLLSGALPPQKGNRTQFLEGTIRDLLTTAGLQEAISYSLTTAATDSLFDAGPHVELVNPISPERAVMRRSLLTNLFEAVAHNLKSTDTVKLFELGAVFHPVTGERLPKEPGRLAIVLTGRRAQETWDNAGKGDKLDFFDLKGIVEHLAAALHLPKVTFQASKEVVYLHPGRTAELLVDGKKVGVLGELHPRTLKALGLGEQAYLVADLDLEALLPLVPERFAYAPVPQFPAALRDVAVVVDESLSNEAVVKEIKAAGGDMLSSVRLFDVYRGESIAEGKKSLAYALSYQADRTLNEKEIDKAHKKIEDRLKHVLKAGIRGKE